MPKDLKNISQMQDFLKFNISWEKRGMKFICRLTLKFCTGPIIVYLFGLETSFTGRYSNGEYF